MLALSSTWSRSQFPTSLGVTNLMYAASLKHVHALRLKKNHTGSTYKKHRRNLDFIDSSFTRSRCKICHISFFKVRYEVFSGHPYPDHIYNFNRWGINFCVLIVALRYKDSTIILINYSRKKYFYIYFIYCIIYSI